MTEQQKPFNIFDVLSNLVDEVEKWKRSDQAEELVTILEEIREQAKSGKFDHLKEKKIKPSDLFK